VRTRTTVHSAPDGAGELYELEVVPGLEPIVHDELRERLGLSVAAHPTGRDGRLSLRWSGEPAALLGLRTVSAVHLVERFDVRWPGALLEPHRLDRMVDLARRAIALHPPASFTTLRISAAGADSPELTRLAAEIADALGLAVTREAPQLQIAIRRSDAWEALVRLSPRPLSTRPWRVCNLPGALHAAVASAMVRLAGPWSDERYLNVASGSGTLLVERLAQGPAARAVGVDLDSAAIECASANLAAAGADAALVRGDVVALPFPTASFDTVVTDLPYGMLMGRPETNRDLYPAVLAEAGRVVVGGGTMVAITASARLLERAIDASPAWSASRALRLAIPFRGGYVKPTVYVLGRLRIVTKVA
jgi:ubiquinone/menaquinone biosynthesis C-methylase UbiE